MIETTPLPTQQLLAEAYKHMRTDWEREFLASVNRQYESNRNLSAKQLAILEKIIHREMPPVAAPFSIDLRPVPAGRYAVPGGDTRLKVHIQKPTKEDSKWNGWIFVKDAAVYGQGRRYGRQKPGEHYKGEISEALRIIAADPIAAFAAYGKLTGTCGVCGRALEDETSVARGIGPICWGRLHE